MNIKYTCPYWGQEHLAIEDFLDKVVLAGYDGVEINLPEEGPLTGEFMDALEVITVSNPKFMFIAQQVLPPANETVQTYISRMTKQLYHLTCLQPDFINSHTGKDYFSFDNNCRVIEAALEVSAKTGVRILHETHRGRFSFHAATLLPYLEKFPELELVADFSHFCVVSESLLQDQEHIINELIPHVGHIHARVGSEQAPQVAAPKSPEWATYVKTYLSWWQKIILYRQNRATKSIAVTPEHGPVPYMPVLPYTKQPLSNGWQDNLDMKALLTHSFTKIKTTNLL